MVKKKIEFNSKVENIRDIDKYFAFGDLKVAFCGKNRNGSDLTKESFENAVPTMYNKPIVVNYLPDKEDSSGEDGDFGGHDVELKTVDGEYKIQPITQPLGVVPESATWSWEETEDEVEGTHKFFTIHNLILWKRQPAYEKAKELKSIKHSMEIEILDGFEEDGYFKITKFNFDVFCLLGTDVEPCFHSSSLDLAFSKDKTFEEAYKLMISDLKELKLDFNKGGNDLEDNKKIDNEDQGKEFENEPKVENENKTEETNKFSLENLKNLLSQFELSYRDTYDELYNLLEPAMESDEEWYWIIDVWDDYFTYEGICSPNKLFKQYFKKEEDKITLDGERIPLYRMELTEEEKTQIENMRKNYSLLETENESLKQKIKDFELKEDKTIRESIYSEFENIFENMEEIKKSTKEVKTEALKEKLFALEGERLHSFSKKQSEKNKVKVKNDVEDEFCPYPSLAKYMK